MARFARLSLVFALGMACVSCSDFKPKTANDIARAWCAAYFSRLYGVSFDDATRAICIVPEVLAPFLRATQEGDRDAGREAEGAAQRAGVAR